MDAPRPPDQRFRSLHWFVVAIASLALLLNLAATRRNANVRPYSWFAPAGILFVGIAGIAGRQRPYLQRALVTVSLLLALAAILSLLRG